MGRIFHNSVAVLEVGREAWWELVQRTKAPPKTKDRRVSMCLRKKGMASALRFGSRSDLLITILELFDDVAIWKPLAKLRQGSRARSAQRFCCGW